jgi:hypothetical protein
VLVDFLCEKIAGDVCASGDAADARWFTPEEVEKLSMPEDTRNVLQLGLTKGK